MRQNCTFSIVCDLHGSESIDKMTKCPSFLNREAPLQNRTACMRAQSPQGQKIHNALNESWRNKRDEMKSTFVTVLGFKTSRAFMQGKRVGVSCFEKNMSCSRYQNTLISGWLGYKLDFPAWYRREHLCTLSLTLQAVLLSSFSQGMYFLLG